MKYRYCILISLSLMATGLFSFLAVLHASILAAVERSGLPGCLFNLLRFTELGPILFSCAVIYLIGLILLLFCGRGSKPNGPHK